MAPYSSSDGSAIDIPEKESTFYYTSLTHTSKRERERERERESLPHVHVDVAIDHIPRGI